MIFLTDNGTEEGSRLLWTSLQAAFSDAVTGVSISESGFLPAGMMSPFAFFMGERIPTAAVGRPLFFNEVPVPEYWQIRGTGSSAEVWDYEHLRARIFYAESKYQRHVHVVDWLDEAGAVCSCDYYDRQGRRMAQVIMDGQGHNITKTWYDRQNRIVIYENYPAGEIVLEDYVTDQGRTHVFHSLWQFTDYFLLCSGLDLSRIAYNSLSTAFFAARHLLTDHGIAGRDVLFWQEEVGEKIPGNMQLILDEAGAGGRAQRIAVQSRRTLARILSRPGLGEEEKARFSPVGFVYPFVDRASAAGRTAGTGGLDSAEKGSGRDLLILTNSDQICSLQILVEALPEFTFHIGALTEMSEKLLAFGHYPNVDLRPNIAVPEAMRLLDSCWCYLDINYGGEILSGAREAFLRRMPILAFDDTVHEKTYTAPANVFSHEKREDVLSMAAVIRGMAENPAAYESLRAQQEEIAMTESVETYRRLW